MLDLNPPPDRPDPSIYSQAPLLAAGTAVTWNNPDIVVSRPPFYSALVTVRNSATAAAINTVVAVSYGPSGIGMPRTPLTTQLVSLAPGEARQLSIPLPQDTLSLSSDGFNPPSLFVDLSHPYDADITNNQGALCSAYSTGTAVPGTVPIALSNVTADPITYSLSVEPNTLGVTLSSAQVTVAPGSTGGVWVVLGTPPAPPANTPFTVVARDAQGNLAGGFTWVFNFG